MGQIPTRQPKSKARAHKRAERKTFSVEMEEWLAKGLKPHTVEVTARGKIDGACQEKNA
jgi:hypothetical protein